MVLLDKASVDISGIFADFQNEQIPGQAEQEKRPEHKADVASIATGTTPTRVIYPSQDGATAAPGAFPLVVLLHGNGYHWDDYDQLGSLLASQGMVVVIPQFVTGFLGACGGGSSTQQRFLFGVRAARWALEESAKSGSKLQGRLDPAKLVLVGHSWGGAAAEWGLPEIGARAAVIFDPVSLLNNIQEWTTCKNNIVSGSTTPDHLRRTWRDLSTPTLLLDAGASPFIATLTGYRGLYPSAPLVHAALQGTLHEDFLDPEKAIDWIDTGTCFDADRIAAHKRAVAVWMSRFLRRYAEDDLSLDPLVHGPEALRLPPGVFSSGVFVSTYRPAADTLVLDRGAAFPYGSSHNTPRPNLAGGESVVEGGTATIRLTPSRIAALEAMPDNVFKQGDIAYLTSDDHAAYRKISVQQEASPVTLRESFSTPLDASNFRLLALDMALGQTFSWYNCSQSLPDLDATPLDAVLRLTSSDGKSAELGGAALSGASTSYNTTPFSLMAPLQSLAGKVDLSRITSIEVTLPAGPQPRAVTFDDLRLIR
ncbi:MAG: alpha/beta fold hydrolase [Polyangiaceae bacterium]|nr:alpha/beta fold hydrolase [Polyangiaceae bacterium]